MSFMSTGHRGYQEKTGVAIKNKKYRKKFTKNIVSIILIQKIVRLKQAVVQLLVF